MGKRGPFSKGKALQILHGSKPLTAEAMENLKEQFIPPEMPNHFNEREIEAWNKTIELLRSSMSLREIDGAVLGAYCSAFVRWQDAEKQIQKFRSIKNGLCIVDKKGKPKKISPLVTISRDAQRDMVFYAAQLGMTPSSRIKMLSDVGKVMPKNPFFKIKEMKQ